MEGPHDPADIPLVFLHGLGTGGRAWRPQQDELGDRRRTFAPNLPGFGGAPGPFSIASACTAVAELLQSDPAAVLDLCGLSLGALVALEFAVQHPDRVRRLILCCGFARLPVDLRERQQRVAMTLRHLPLQAFGDVIADFTSTVPQPYRAAATEDLARLSPDDFAGIIERTCTFDRAEDAAKLNLPSVVVCCGQLDEPNIPLSRNLADLLRTELHIIAGATHVANLDAPGEFTALL